MRAYASMVCRHLLARLALSTEPRLAWRAQRDGLSATTGPSAFVRVQILTCMCDESAATNQDCENFVICFANTQQIRAHVRTALHKLDRIVRLTAPRNARTVTPDGRSTITKRSVTVRAPTSARSSATYLTCACA